MKQIIIAVLLLSLAACATPNITWTDACPVVTNKETFEHPLGQGRVSYCPDYELGFKKNGTVVWRYIHKSHSR